MTGCRIGPAVIECRGELIEIPALRCHCGSPEIMAVSPGQESLRGPGGILVQRGKPTAAWCRTCYPKRMARVARQNRRLRAQSSLPSHRKGSTA